MTTDESKISICTMTKNQGNRLEEWIRYHNQLGFNKFIIYLDDCSDNSYDILKTIKDINIVIYKTENFSEQIKNLFWINKSHEMYNHALKNNFNDEWIAFIEVDEFIFAQTNDLKLNNFLRNLKTDCFYINSWDFKGPFDENKKILGQCNFIWTDEQRFNSEYIYRGKSIIKPNKFKKCIDAHHFMKKDGTISNEFKNNRNSLIQIFYGEDLSIDDSKFKIYHFRNHTPKNMSDYKYIKYL